MTALGGEASKEDGQAGEIEWWVTAARKQYGADTSKTLRATDDPSQIQ
jgi:hypothetical protein